MYENPELCSKCGGHCCKTMPGCCLPEDFGLPDTLRLVAALTSGDYAIDSWDGTLAGAKHKDVCHYYIRPATKIARGKRYDPSWGGECIFLGPSGCSLQADERPSGCRMLEPGEKSCTVHAADKERAALAWEPYSEVLYAAMETKEAS